MLPCPDTGSHRSHGLQMRTIAVTTSIDARRLGPAHRHIRSPWTSRRFVAPPRPTAPCSSLPAHPLNRIPTRFCPVRLSGMPHAPAASKRCRSPSSKGPIVHDSTTTSPDICRRYAEAACANAPRCPVAPVPGEPSPPRNAPRHASGLVLQHVTQWRKGSSA